MEMFLASHTYGLFSVNRRTFNQQCCSGPCYPRPIRNAVVTSLRVFNLCSLLGGYSNRFKMLSGGIRILTGAGIGIITLSIGDPNAKKEAIIGHFYYEALSTSAAQMMRGGIEAFVPHGRVVNGVLDVGMTIPNFIHQLPMGCGCYADPEFHSEKITPHQEPVYPILLWAST